MERRCFEMIKFGGEKGWVIRSCGVFIMRFGRFLGFKGRVGLNRIEEAISQTIFDFLLKITIQSRHG